MKLWPKKEDAPWWARLQMGTLKEQEEEARRQEPTRCWETVAREDSEEQSRGKSSRRAATRRES
jgi:hypothetical protein